MANKKDFESINTSKVDTGITAGKVIDSIERTSSTKKKQGLASPEERAQRQAENRTQGRAGCKMKRINLAFSDPNYQYISTMSRAAGVSMTAYINKIIEQHKETHIDIYNQAIEFQKSMTE